MADLELVVLPRQALFEFFGEVALTPWPSDGDCAAKAEQIGAWVDKHDLSDAYLSPTVRAASGEGDHG